MIELGTKVKDSITGFEGVATGRTVYLNGCVQVLVEPPVGDDGQPGKSHWVDEQRLDTTSAATAGGPQPTPPGMPHP